MKYPTIKTYLSIILIVFSIVSISSGATLSPNLTNQIEIGNRGGIITNQVKLNAPID